MSATPAVASLFAIVALALASFSAVASDESLERE
jgi:hypothetical protein